MQTALDEHWLAQQHYLAELCAQEASKRYHERYTSICAKRNCRLPNG